MQKLVPIVLLLILVSPFKAGSEEIIKKDELLTLERCIEIALKRHPNIMAAMNTIEVNRSLVGQAESNYYPQIEWSSGYSRIKSVSTRTAGQFVTGQSLPGTASTTQSSNQPFDFYESSFSLSQNIFDFGKTPTQVRVKKLTLYSSSSDYENVINQIVFNVRQAYYSVLQTKRNRDVAEETVRQFQQHLDQARGFYEVGTRPKFDVTKAEVDLSNSKLSLIKAENALRIAKVTLNNAIGVPDAPDYTIVDILAYQKYRITFEDAIERAYKNRPDLQSLVLQERAAEESIQLAKTGYYPVLSGQANYNWAGTKVNSLDSGWNVGATLTFPLFSGYLTKYQVAQSKAALDVLKANEENLRQGILLDVQQAYLNLQQAEESISTAELTVKQATENLDLANGRYAVGVGNPIEVTDAQVSYSSAKTTYNQALYDYKVAQASLEKAMGGK